MRSASNSATIGQHVEQQPADRVGRVVHGAAEAEPDPPSRELVGDRPGVRQGPGQPVEFGDDQGVALAAGGQRFPQTRSVAVAAGQSMVDIDPVGSYAQCGEPFALDGEVLFVGRAVQVAAALGATRDLAALYEVLAPHRGLHVSGRGGALYYSGPLDLYLGLAAAHLGRLDAAAAHLERAVDAFADNGAAGFHAEALCELITVLTRRATPATWVAPVRLPASAASRWPR